MIHQATRQVGAREAEAMKGLESSGGFTRAAGLFGPPKVRGASQAPGFRKLPRLYQEGFVWDGVGVGFGGNLWMRNFWFAEEPRHGAAGWSFFSTGGGRSAWNSSGFALGCGHRLRLHAAKRSAER